MVICNGLLFSFFVLYKFSLQLYEVQSIVNEIISSDEPVFVQTMPLSSVQKLNNLQSVLGSNLLVTFFFSFRCFTVVFSNCES